MVFKLNPIATTSEIPWEPASSSPQHLETHTRSQTPHFIPYPMDMTWILQHQVYFLANYAIRGLINSERSAIKILNQ